MHGILQIKGTRRHVLIIIMFLLQAIYFSSCEESRETPEDTAEARKLLSSTLMLTIDSIKSEGRKDEDTLLQLSNSDSGDLTSTTSPFKNSPNINISLIPISTAAASEGLDLLGNETVKQVLPIRMCKQREVKELNECLREALEEVRPRMARGIPELGLLGVDPLRLQHLSFQHGSGPITISSQFSEIEVTGLSQFNKSDFWVDIASSRLDFDVTFPNLILAGSYELTGNMFFVPISGVGNFWLNLGGISSKGTGRLTVSKTGESHERMELKNTELDLNIDSIKVHLTNLFNGDRLLGSVVNNFLNENSQDIFEELRPQITAQVKETLQTLANQALVALPVDFFDNVPLDPSSDDNMERGSSDLPGN